MCENPNSPSDPNTVNASPNPNRPHTDEIDDWPVFPEKMTYIERENAQNMLDAARQAKHKDPKYRLTRPEIFPWESHWDRLSLRKQIEVIVWVRKFYMCSEQDECGDLRMDHPIVQAWAFPPPLPPDPIDLSGSFETYNGPKISHYLESMIGTDKEERPFDIWSKIVSASTTADPLSLEDQGLWLVTTGREGRIMLLLAPVNRMAPYIGGGSPCPIQIQGQPNFFTITGEAQALGHMPNAAKLAGGANELARLAIFWPAGEKLLTPAHATANVLDC